ncbi:alcohol dehydrogenase catalytic domain-containing protein [Candidatus Bathycorpusculum sp.]|uniref:zinc-dependent alcohol dehydrogenase n=1 Tax=Candidatus Bathycorpusculum sp. TaxID=2994959 RepID=UPI0028280125|nr:alcohol dehydrogenase catalytic domain-containing protein [Candidatus Termitimicrobium sp.]MCL2684934.1 alcohol dehydrogenase catalytic domain-containing protein [Candidatus Termitimicrobium sp.]
MRFLLYRVTGSHMKALRLEGIEKIQLIDIQPPVCDSTETLLKVTYCSVCRTDAKMWSQGQRDLVLPRVLGHEICGHKPNNPAENFVVWPAKTCNQCHYCKSGAENLCSNIQVIGFHIDGGFAQYIKVPKRSLIKIPPTVPPEIACMTELLSSAINATEQVNLQKNQTVLIFGGGPAGLMLGLACKYFGAHPFIVEKNSAKLNQVTPFCKKANIYLSDTPAGNFDVAINAAPDPSALIEGISKLNPGGKYCLFSGFTKNTPIPSELLNEVHYRQLTLIGAYGSTKRQMKLALKIIETNTQTLRLLIDKIIRLENVPLVLPKILLGQSLKYVVDLTE